MKSLVQDDIYGNLRSEMCMRIANVIPNYESKDERMCEMLMVKGLHHDPVPVWVHPEVWEEVQKACWHATEGGWTTYVAQMAQDNHERRICQLVESAKDNHVQRMYSDPEYWHGFSKQERNINKLFTSTINLVEQVENGSLSIIDFGIELGHLK